MDELSDTEDSDSDDGDGSFHVENSKLTTIEKQRRKRATNSNTRDSPPTLLQELEEEDDIDDLYGNDCFLVRYRKGDTCLNVLFHL